MACPDIDLLGFLKNEPGKHSPEEIRRHLEECFSCRSDWEQTRTVLHLLQTDPWIEPSRDFVRRVLEAVRLEYPDSARGACPGVDLLGYLKETVGSAAKEEIRRHLTECLPCLADLARTRKVLSLLHSDPWVEPSPDFAERVLAALPPVPAAEKVDWFAALKEFFFGRRIAVSWGFSLAVHTLLFLSLAMVTVSVPEPPEDIVSLSPSVPLAPPPPPPADKGIDTETAPAFDPTVLEPWEFASRPRRETDRPDPVPARPTPIVPVEPERRVLQWSFDRSNAMAAYLRNRPGMTSTEFGGEYLPAVQQALRWLAANQNDDGSWTSPDRLMSRDYQVAVTGLCLLPFLSAQFQHREGPFSTTLRRGLSFLMQVQDPASGRFGSWANSVEVTGNHMYGQALATTALLEAYLITGDRMLEPACKQGLTYISRVQSQDGGWRYVANEPAGDMASTAWQVQALRLGIAAGFGSVASSALVRARNFCRSMLDEQENYGYRAANRLEHGPLGPLATGMFVYLMTTEAPDVRLLESQFSKLMSYELVQPEQNNLVMLYFGGLAAYQVGGDVWSQWWAKTTPEISKRQAKDGSWHRDFDIWSAQGGQCYVTAISTLNLLVYRRYPPLHR